MPVAPIFLLTADGSLITRPSPARLRCTWMRIQDQVHDFKCRQLAVAHRCGAAMEGNSSIFAPVAKFQGRGQALLARPMLR